MMSLEHGELEMCLKGHFLPFPLDFQGDGTSIESRVKFGGEGVAVRDLSSGVEL